MIINRCEAISSLLKGTNFHIDGDGKISYLSGQKALTDSQINNEKKRLQEKYDSESWKRSRLAAYPKLDECIHAILDDDLASLQEKRKAVKSKYPKP